MDHKKWIQILIFIFSSIIIASIMLVIIIDPFRYIREKNYETPDLNFEKSKYINAGMVRHLPYNAVVIGTSHSKNISLKRLSSELGLKSPIKLSMAGATAHDVNKLLTLIFQQSSPDHVLYQLDVGSYQGAIDRSSRNFPEYLYDDSIKSLFRYITDSTVKKESIVQLYNYLLTHRKKYTNPSDITDIYVEDFVKRSIRDIVRLYQHQKKYYIYDELLDNFNHNLLTHIINHPDTKFIIYHPPFSILYYKALDKNESLKNYLQFKKSIYEITKPLGNVEIYDFQTINDITHKLNNYSDTTHFHSFINDQIIDYLSNKEYIVNDKNVDCLNTLLFEQVKKYCVL